MRPMSPMTPLSNDVWPALPYEAWKDTYATLHMWTQIVGKVALALAPPLNHSWGIATHATARGLSPRPLLHQGRTFTMEFAFADPKLVARTSDGVDRTRPPAPHTGAASSRAGMA